MPKIDARGNVTDATVLDEDPADPVNDAQPVDEPRPVMEPKNDKPEPKTGKPTTRKS